MKDKGNNEEINEKKKKNDSGKKVLSAKKSIRTKKSTSDEIIVKKGPNSKSKNENAEVPAKKKEAVSKKKGDSEFTSGKKVYKKKDQNSVAKIVKKKEKETKENLSEEVIVENKKERKKFFRNKELNVSKKKNNDLFRKFIGKFLYVVLGFVICILLFFVLCGGKNYFRLYYELREFIDVYDVVTTDYYGELDKDELISGAIDAMFVNINDYYTTYIDKDSADSFLEDVNGTYEGIGCMISTNVDGEIYIVEVFDDTPSSEAGLLENDVILKVNDEDYSDKTSLDMSEFVKNSDLEKIDLTIKRGEEIIDVTINREKIEIPVVNSQVIEYEGEKIGYISIDVFSSVSYEQIQSKLKKLEKKEISGLVIDVRNNSGGYLNAVTDISSLFLKKGKVIYQLEDEDGARKVKDTSKEYRSYPIAVLVNSGSASASEIFASAIKESYGGFVVGTNTYGKGTVQKTKVLSDGSMIKYTVQNWLTPDGNFINEVGVTPTNVVALDYELGYDNQLEEALKLIIEEAD